MGSPWNFNNFFYTPVKSRKPYDFDKTRYEKYKIKILATGKVYYAHKTGKLVRKDYCESCGISSEYVKIYAHHHDYEKPLEVTYLCASCHHFEHPNRFSFMGRECPRCFGRTDEKYGICAECRKSQEDLA